MTTEELNIALSDSFLNHDINGIKSAYKSYLVGRCHNPIKIKIKDSFTNEFREIEIPCGHCYHCRETRTNQWVFRLYAHSEFYKYIYFITLDYAPIYQKSDQMNYVISKLGKAVYHLDDLNSTHRLAFHPTLLCKEHYQNFLKRLRSIDRLKDAQLSYFLCGEYGKKFSRPHFHILLFSNEPVFQKDLDYCWSLFYVKNKQGKYVQHTNQKYTDIIYQHKIGTVKLDDLKANGNFNQYKTVNIDGQKYEAKYCFKYVCKYMFKTLYPDTRVKLAYQQLFPKMLQPDETAHRYAIWLRTNLESDELIPIRTSYKLLYPQDYSFICPDKIPTYEVFKKTYAPFTECSRSTAIGRNFLQAHLQEYQSGNFIKPKFYVCPACVVPSYFLRKLEQSIFSLDRCQITRSQDITYNRGSLLDFLETLKSRDFRKGFNRLYNYICQDISEVKPRLNDYNAPNFINRFTSVHYHVCCVNSEYIVALYYFNRSTRNYEFLKTQTIETFCDEQLQKLNHLYVHYDKKIMLSNIEKQQQNQTSNLLDFYFFGDHLTDDEKSKNMIFLNLRSELCDEIVQDAINYKNLHTKPDNDL